MGLGVQQARLFRVLLPSWRAPLVFFFDSPNDVVVQKLPTLFRLAAVAVLAGLVLGAKFLQQVRGRPRLLRARER